MFTSEATKQQKKFTLLQNRFAFQPNKFAFLQNKFAFWRNKFTFRPKTVYILVNKFTTFIEKLPKSLHNANLANLVNFSEKFTKFTKFTLCKLFGNFSINVVNFLTKMQTFLGRNVNLFYQNANLIG